MINTRTRYLKCGQSLSNQLHEKTAEEIDSIINSTVNYNVSRFYYIASRLRNLPSCGVIRSICLLSIIS
jgi:hypothetical protein